MPIRDPCRNYYVVENWRIKTKDRHTFGLTSHMTLIAYKHGEGLKLKGQLKLKTFVKFSSLPCFPISCHQNGRKFKCFMMECMTLSLFRDREFLSSTTTQKTLQDLSHLFLLTGFPEVRTKQKQSRKHIAGVKLNISSGTEHY